MRSTSVHCYFKNKVDGPSPYGEVPRTMYGLSESGRINSKLFDLWYVHLFASCPNCMTNSTPTQW